MICSIVPPYLLRRLAAQDEPRLRAVAVAAKESLLHIKELQAVRSAPAPAARPAARQARPGGPHRTIYDAQGVEQLPGKLVRKEGAAATGDVAADEAYEGLGSTYSLYADVFGRDSIDGAGLPLDATVHYGRLYDNAFWDGQQMVFGDGDGEVFQRFTKSLSVIGHELAHGVTQFTAGLAYRNQAGALNESMSDVFGVLVEQYFKKQSASEANWLIGEGLFTNHVQGVALRSMKAPGTAYDDDVLGKDPQPDSMDTYVRTSADNGGVHINSGIPNKAFYVVASELGGNAWEAPGQIWYGTLTSGTLPPACTFGKFARTTLATAEELFGAGSAEHDAVRKAWDTVKVRV
ncbi:MULTISPECIES: M4 family metallopeptidase [Paenarthrobacter]|uniref:Neutral metalloproteinase n=1 Tax=Paenarthrobacter ureafaciens TaxID=37931 RepID=A0AAX3EDQ4_PAEUR|nr:MULTISPECIES: M4 family metallopeptidase [Paenarthrobacter]KUR66115.1 peptidase M4 [Arthrobacter sp. ATCC 21022]BCW84847.1 metalloprotease [Arthrobacter sp. NicSoilE8]MDO5865366.1 M4 family metallopeptidase [Paenarthrobacter sp. SD-2]MDO5876443.1 M4 family metallopeptidase [Paenarthrobacter sp. SD-1]MEC3850328.1 M4 family metallopeptidase [Paenarthrobacter ureafaciens]